MPSSSPPAVTIGPTIVALSGSDWPLSSTQTAANQYVEPGFNCKTVLFPEITEISKLFVNAKAFVISCSTAQSLVLEGSISVHADHSA